MCVPCTCKFKQRFLWWLLIGRAAVKIGTSPSVQVSGIGGGRFFCSSGLQQSLSTGKAVLPAYNYARQTRLYLNHVCDFSTNRSVTKRHVTSHTARHTWRHASTWDTARSYSLTIADALRLTAYVQLTSVTPCVWMLTFSWRQWRELEIVYFLETCWVPL